MKFGIFLAPFHKIGENPTLAMDRDMELIEWMDYLGYDEVWIGEHHSAGWELIASPEIFIAAAAQRTRHIRLGTGVSSLPYHHPLMLADRMQQLDHQTRGRVMFGVGPGALPSDAVMLGIDPLRQRDMMDEALDVIVRLLRGEAVSHKSDWFTLEEARLQLPPYTRPHMEMAVAAMVSPSGPRAAGKYGIGMLSIGTVMKTAYMSLSTAWGIVEEMAREHGQQVSRRDWRIVTPMHIAETREKALENVRFGLGDWIRYYTEVIALPFELTGTLEDRVEQYITTGHAIIGDPDDAIARIEELQTMSGGFGCLLQLAHNWADFPETLKSYELMARFVMPHFQRSNVGREESTAWSSSRRDELMRAGRMAKELAAKKHAEERKS
jgi:limonene 1,2-monooxygenase